MNINLVNAAAVATVISTIIATVGLFKYKSAKNEKLFEDKYDALEKTYKALSESAGLINELPKDNVRTTTVKQFLSESKEGDLKYGDCVSIATNDLKYYDLLPQYIEILIDNLKKGVVYKYYLPDEASLREQAQELCKLIVDKAGYDVGKQMLNSVQFYRSSIHVIYNIAVVKENNKDKCYWYFAFSPDQEGDNLCIVTFHDRTSSSITKIMAKIAEHSALENINLPLL